MVGIRFRSISARLLFTTIVLVVVLFGGLGIVIARKNAGAIQNALDLKIDSLTQLTAHVGQGYLENYNFQGLDRLIENVLRDPDSRFASFYNEENKLVSKDPEPENVDRLIVIERKIADAEERPLGTLKIGFSRAAVDENLRANLYLVTGGTLLAIALFIVGVIIVVRGITRPLVLCLADTERIAGGDLTVEPRSGRDDEVGRLMTALQQMVEKLRAVVGDVKQASDNVAAGSQELSSSAEEMSQGASRAGGVGRGGLGLDGGDGLEHPAERGQRAADREDRAEGGRGRARGGQGGRRRRSRR